MATFGWSILPYLAFLQTDSETESGVQKVYQGVSLGDSSEGCQEGRTRQREKLITQCD